MTYNLLTYNVVMGVLVLGFTFIQDAKKQLADEVADCEVELINSGD